MYKKFKEYNLITKIRNKNETKERPKAKQTKTKRETSGKKAAPSSGPSIRLGAWLLISTSLS